MSKEILKKYQISVIDGQNKHIFTASDGDNLLDVLQQNGVLVQASCGGKGTCQKCRVKINGQGTQLACHYKISADIKIHLPDLKAFVILDELNPAARIMENQSGIKIEIHNDKKVVMYQENQILSEKVDRDRQHSGYGIAVDIGTTTVVVYLLDIINYIHLDNFSFLNPQSSYGADVITRIEYCIREEAGVQHLQSILIRKINQAISNMCEEHRIDKADIYLATMVGNTIMLHMFLGVNPAPISFAPYTPVFTEQKRLKGSELKLTMHERGIVKVLPSISGYVGADILAGVASTDLAIRKSYTLYLDIGTNGEIVLGKKNEVYCCATAAGPAFEGAKIQCGVGAVTGAISMFDNEGYTTIDGKLPVGICGSGLIDIIAYLLDQGLIDQTGLMGEDFLIEKKENMDIEDDIVLTQKDIREVQLAKSAIYAGIHILMKEAGVSYDQIETVYLAGGFGNYIKIESAIRIGLLSEELEGKIVSIGNGAGTGAIAALKSIPFEKEIEKIAKKTNYIELSTRPDFMEAYVEAMAFSSTNYERISQIISS